MNNKLQIITNFKQKKNTHTHTPQQRQLLRIGAFLAKYTRRELQQKARRISRNPRSYSVWKIRVFVSVRFRREKMRIWEVEVEDLDNGNSESFRVVVEIVLRNCTHSHSGCIIRIGFFVPVIFFHVSRQRKWDFGPFAYTPPYTNAYDVKSLQHQRLSYKLLCSISSFLFDINIAFDHFYLILLNILQCLTKKIIILQFNCFFFLYIYFEGILIFFFFI